MTQTETSPAYTLYELTPVKGSRANRLSPFVWRTKGDLALLNIPYETVPYTFGQIRTDLAEATGKPAVTVPTLKSGNGYVTDSHSIAVWLHRRHPGILFPTPDAQLLSYFLDRWADTEFAPVVRDLFRPLFALYQDDETRTYFINVKNGNDPIKARKLIHDGIVSLDDPVKAEEIAVRVRAKLGLFESLLAETASRGPFVRGDTASHADLALWGWYVSSQVNPNVNALLWHHESLPNVKLWAEATANATRFVSPFEYVSEERKQEVLEELLAGVDAARA